MLQFFGRGSAFADTFNSAFFIAGSDIVVIDCNVTAFHALKKMDLTGIDNIRVLITHTHSDHIGGLALIVDYEYFIGHIPVTVYAPNKQVYDDLRYFMRNIDGCDDSWYTMKTVSGLDADWFIAAIPTTHTQALEGKCFGYALKIDGTTVVYTGDTCTTAPYVKYLTPGSVLYMEISSHKSDVHLYAPDVKGFIEDTVSKGCKVYLMHIDDEEEILRQTAETGAKLAPLYRECSGGACMNKNDSMILDEIYNISDKLYEAMCSNRENDHTMLFDSLTELGKTIVGADRGSFWKWDTRREELWTTSATGIDRIVIPDTTGLVGKALHSGHVVITNDPYNDPDFNSAVDKQTGYVTRSVLVLPVADINGKFIGAFQLINKLGDTSAFEEQDVRKLSLAALICGIALESETFLEDSHHDKLTKLKNRMGFYNDFSRKYNRYMQPGCDKPLSMFICDIDKFKRVNDTYGHNAGDDVLAFCADLIARSCTEKDSAYRWGGEEFIMIMQDTTLEEAVQKAEKLRRVVEASDFPADGNTIHCTLSFGCTTFALDKTIEENISVADGHLYTAKESGRNRVVF